MFSLQKERGGAKLTSVRTERASKAEWNARRSEHLEVPEMEELVVSDSNRAKTGEDGLDSVVLQLVGRNADGLPALRGRHRVPSLPDGAIALVVDIHPLDAVAVHRRPPDELVGEGSEGREERLGHARLEHRLGSEGERADERHELGVGEGLRSREREGRALGRDLGVHEVAKGLSDVGELEKRDAGSSARVGSVRRVVGKRAHEQGVDARGPGASWSVHRSGQRGRGSLHVGRSPCQLLMPKLRVGKASRVLTRGVDQEVVLPSEDGSRSNDGSLGEVFPDEALSLRLRLIGRAEQPGSARQSAARKQSWHVKKTYSVQARGRLRVGVEMRDVDEAGDVVILRDLSNETRAGGVNVVERVVPTKPSLISAAAGRERGSGGITHLVSHSRPVQL